MSFESISSVSYTAGHFLTWLPFSLQEHLYFFTRLNVSEYATAKGVASTAPLVKSRSVASREENLKTLAAEEDFFDFA